MESAHSSVLGVLAEEVGGNSLLSGETSFDPQKRVLLTLVILSMLRACLDNLKGGASEIRRDLDSNRCLAVDEQFSTCT